MSELINALLEDSDLNLTPRQRLVWTVVAIVIGALLASPLLLT